MDAKLLRIAGKFESQLERKSKVSSVADKFMRKFAQEELLPRTEEQKKLDPWMLDGAPEEAVKPWTPPPTVIPEVTVEGDPNAPDPDEIGASGPKPAAPKPEPKPFNWKAPPKAPPPASLAPPFKFPKTEEEEKLEPWLVKEQAMQKRVNYFLKLGK